MEKKIIYKSVLKVTVLSDEPLPECISLEDVQYGTDEGEWLGHVEWEYNNAETVGAEAVNNIVQAGSDPEFFQMDDKGNELEE